MSVGINYTGNFVVTPPDVARTIAVTYISNANWGMSNFAHVGYDGVGDEVWSFLCGGTQSGIGWLSYTLQDTYDSTDIDGTSPVC